ncbi:hypothetical protein OC834_007194 [Tilletia horrida]|nr:hypothetical protein OC834_007194 [Tilletia horrida]
MPAIDLDSDNFSEDSGDLDRILEGEVNRRPGDNNDDDDDEAMPQGGQVPPPSQRKRKERADADDADNGRQEDQDGEPQHQMHVDNEDVAAFRSIYGLHDTGCELIVGSIEKNQPPPTRPCVWILCVVVKVWQLLCMLYDEMNDAVGTILRRQDSAEAKMDNILQALEEMKISIEDLKKERLPAEEISKLMQIIGQVFYSGEVDSYMPNGSLFPSLERLLTNNPLLVGPCCKAILEGDDDSLKREQIWSPIKTKLSNLKCNARDYIVKSIKNKDSLLELFKTCTNSYKVRMTKPRLVRLALLRFYTRKLGGRTKDGKPTPNFWSSIDESIRKMYDEQRRDPDKVKKQLHAILQNDKKEFGSFQDSAMLADTGVEAEIRAAFRGVVNASA